jgi:hypothetical protein
MDYTMESPVGARTLINGRWRDYFSGCSYLGLQSHPDLLAAAAAALRQYGLGTATSRGGYGEHPLYREVEAAAAAYWGTEAAVYYVTAYLGNAVLAQGLREDYDRIFLDAASHYSVWDGARTAGAAIHPFGHLDPADLAVQLRRHLRPGERPVVFSDGVFPISGEIAPASAYCDVLAAYDGALLCLDDAHATGVLGEHGRLAVPRLSRHAAGAQLDGAANGCQVAVILSCGALHAGTAAARAAKARGAGGRGGGGGRLGCSLRKGAMSVAEAIPSMPVAANGERIRGGSQRGPTFMILGGAIDTGNLGVSALGTSAVKGILSAFPDARIIFERRRGSGPGAKEIPRGQRARAGHDVDRG